MKKVLFITSRTADVRSLYYKVRNFWKVSMLKDLNTASREITVEKYDFILFDIGLSGFYSPDLLFQITSVVNHPPVFILSREYSFNFFTLARQAGVCGYFHIPYNEHSLVNKIEQYFEASGSTFSAPPVDGVFDQLEKTILGKSVSMTKLRKEIHGIHTRTEPVLIYGETGSGKELVARMIHEHSPVSAGPYTIMNVSCITPSLAESILFGTMRSSYTGATDAMGLFEQSDKGTLFLDEIGELEGLLQSKFLRVLEDKQVSRLGSSKSSKIDFRLVCASNRKMKEYSEAGFFRRDLLHRIDVLRIDVPPLRDRLEDIPLLASFRLQGFHKVLSNNALEKLHYHSWPGNVRELFNCLVRGACSCQTETIYPDQIVF